MNRQSMWPKLLVNLGMQLDRANLFDQADECFRAANRICTRRVLVTKKFIIDAFCRPAMLADKKAEHDQIMREIKRLKSTECRTIAEALFHDLTHVKKQIKFLEAAQ